MDTNTKAAAPLSISYGQVIQISSFQERPRGPKPPHVAEDDPRGMILLAEQAHIANRIAQAERLIEKAYSLYDQCQAKASSTSVIASE